MANDQLAWKAPTTEELVTATAKDGKVWICVWSTRPGENGRLVAGPFTHDPDPAAPHHLGRWFDWWTTNGRPL